MGKSVLYAGNGVTQAIAAAGTVISFPEIVRRTGCACDLSGGNAVVSTVGYFDVDVNLTIGGTEDGTLVVQLYKDGVAVPFAKATVVTTATSIESITIPAVVRNTCCCESVLTVVASGVVANVTNAGIVVAKE